jgi:hypothetical protein
MHHRITHVYDSQQLATADELKQGRWSDRSMHTDTVRIS